MKQSLTLVAPFVISLLVILGFTLAFYLPHANASAPSGLAASVATTSNPTVTTSASLVIATSTACASRVISTSASPIMITFSDIQGKIPTGSFGHLQTASTTVAYDSGLYGCGAVRIYSFASQLITVSETR